MNAPRAPEAPSAASLLAIPRFRVSLFPYCIFTFVDSLDFTLGNVTSHIMCRGYKINWQANVRAYVCVCTVRQLRLQQTQQEISAAFVEDVQEILSALVKARNTERISYLLGKTRRQ